MKEEVLITMKEKSTLHHTDSDTFFMIEKFIKKHDGEFKKKQLWEKLPKKIMYKKFCFIINYLIHSRKVSIDSEGKIGWIYYPKKIKNRLKYSYGC